MHDLALYNAFETEFLMNMRKTFITTAVLAALLGSMWMLPDSATVVTTVRLSSPPDVIFPLIETPKEWQNWSESLLNDKEIVVSYSGPDFGQGARWEWSNGRDNYGFMEIVMAVPSVVIDYQLALGQDRLPSSGGFRLAPTAEGSLIEWSQTTDIGKNPVKRLKGIFLARSVRKNMSNSLQNLDNYARTKPPSEAIRGIELR